MPIDPRMVKWDEEPVKPKGKIDPRMVRWGEEPVKPKGKIDPRMVRWGEEPGLVETIGAGLGAGLGGVALGAQNLVGMGLEKVGIDRAGKWLQKDALAGREKLKGEMAPYKEANPLTAGGAELVSEIAATMPVGGLLAKGAGMIPGMATKAAPLLQSLRTGGMSLGTPAATTKMGMAGNAALRAAGGGATAGASTALIDPEATVTGAAVGAALPGGLLTLGKAGQLVRGSFGGGDTLGKALGVTAEERRALAKALRAAPKSIVEGSDLTVNQALQLAGAQTPAVKMLERTVAGGPGGEVLLKRYADQSAARMAALENQGAQTYQGAAAMEADRGGSLIGSVLRTQAEDDAKALRDAWQETYKRAADEGVMVQLPLDQMQKAMRPLGRGTVGAGSQARALMDEAQNIGTDFLPSINQISASANKPGKNLEQAVRAAGGIQLGKSGLAGELRDLGIRESGTTGLINNKSGNPVDLLAEKMHASGYLPDADSATLLEALRNGRGRGMYAMDDVGGFSGGVERAMGDAPDAGYVAKAVPFEELQRLRRSARDLEARVGSKEGGATESGVLGALKNAIIARVDDAAAGNLLPGENITPGFRDAYQAVRGNTRAFHERYTGGDNIASILRKPFGQNYTLGGNEIMNKVWHGGAGLGDDVQRLRNVLTQENQKPVLDTLQKYIMTDAASKTTAAGDLAAGLPRYVETRMPGLLAALEPEQMSALSSVAKDIDNAAAAANVKGLLGSDTQAKIAWALDAGLLDSTLAKTIGRVKGLDFLRTKGAEMVKSHKGKTIAELLANPQLAAKALDDASFVQRLDPKSVTRLQMAASGSVPALVAD